MNDWNSFDAFSQDYPSASPYEIQSPEVSRACSRFTTEHGCPTPTSVFDEIAGFKFNIDEWDVESESESEGEDVQMMLDSDEVPLRDVIEAWDQLDDKMIMFRMRSDLFVFPTELDFIPPYGADDEPLLDQKSFRNRWFVRHWQFLYGLLEELSRVKSLSDRMAIALQRAVDEVNAELDRVEEYAAKLWEKECQKIERRKVWHNAFSSGYDNKE
ncbi:unnamed protein product [Rhizoctonia solani]|uniref:Uncharacterized protein n=1 Tax=Rhizoctonia solani TaxID=456999 RepID=A0A8H2WMM1_9AGAM|nr:unnamed protein product [Rhizoctonia solani]